MVAAIGIGALRRADELCVLGIGRRCGLTIEQVDLVGHRGVLLVGGARERAERHIALGGKDVRRAHRRFGRGDDGVLLRQVIVLIGVAQTAAAVIREVEIEAVALADGTVVVREPEVARVFSVLVEDPPRARVLKIGLVFLGSGTLLDEPCAIALGHLARVVLEVALAVGVVPADDRHVVVGRIVRPGIVRPGVAVEELAHFVAVGVALVQVICRRNAVTSHELFLHGNHGIRVRELRRALGSLRANRGQHVRIVQRVALNVPERIVDAPVVVLNERAVVVPDRARPALAHDLVGRMLGRIGVDLALRPVFCLGLACALGRDLAHDNGLVVLVGGLRLGNEADTGAEERHTIRNLAARVKVPGVSSAVGALPCLRGAGHTRGNTVLGIDEVDERALRQVKIAHIDAALRGLGENARLGGGDRRKTPAVAPRSLFLRLGHEPEFGQAVALGEPRGRNVGIGKGDGRRRSLIGIRIVAVFENHVVDGCGPFLLDIGRRGYGRCRRRRRAQHGREDKAKRTRADTEPTTRPGYGRGGRRDRQDRHGLPPKKRMTLTIIHFMRAPHRLRIGSLDCNGQRLVPNRHRRALRNGARLCRLASSM